MPKKSLKHLPEAQWPTVDRELFAAAFRTDGDLFDGRGPGSHLKLRTVVSIHYSYRRWLGWLAAFDPTALVLATADRITPERVKEYVSQLQLTQNSVSVAAGVGHLYAAARYMCPERDWTWLKGIKRRLEAIAVPYPPKAIPFTSQRLVDLGIELMAGAEEVALHEKAAHGRIRLPIARQFRDGLLIAAVTLTALRRSNLEGLSLGTTLKRTGDIWVIEIDGEDTKNGDPYMAVLPDWLAERLETYLEHFRSVFFGAHQHPGLWATNRGRPASGQALYKTFTTRILNLTGHHVTLHDVRRIGCTTWAIADPDTAGGARELLGDRDYRVIEKHYNLARSIEASRVHQQNLVALRRKLGQSFEDRPQRPENQQK